MCNTYVHPKNTEICNTELKDRSSKDFKVLAGNAHITWCLHMCYT